MTSRFAKLPYLLPAMLSLTLLNTAGRAAADPTGAGTRPADVVTAMREQLKAKGSLDIADRQTCVDRASPELWTDVQATFFCLLDLPSRACLSAAVDGQVKGAVVAAGDFRAAFEFCKTGSGSGLGVKFAAPLAALSSPVLLGFEAVVVNRRDFSRVEERQILREVFGPATANANESVGPLKALAGPPTAEKESTPSGNFPRTCRIDSWGVRSRQSPSRTSLVTHRLQRTSIVITGPAVDGSDPGDRFKWWPVRLQGGETAFIATGFVVCP